jgi:hypothetical protein
MKKFFILVITLAVFASCSSKEQKPTQNDFVVSVTADTTITQKVPVTAPRYSCDKKQLPFPKLMGFREDSLRIDLGKTIIISADSMNRAGWFWFPSGDGTGTTPSKTQTGMNWFPDWLIRLLEILFWIAVAALAVWLLVELIRAIAERVTRPSTTATSTQGSVPTGPQQQGTTGGNHLTLPAGSQMPTVIIIGNNITTGDIVVGNYNQRSGAHVTRGGKPDEKKD